MKTKSKKYKKVKLRRKKKQDKPTNTLKSELPVKAENVPIPAEQSDPFQAYLQEISKYPLLSKEEEQKLTKAYYETKNPEIAKKIVTANLRLVVKIALDFQKFWMQNFLDLVQEGNIGLMHAVKKFNPDKGVKFSYYASFWIKAYILKFLMDNWRLVKIGTTQAQRKLFYNLSKEKERLQALGFEPVPKLISESLNVSEKEVIEMEQRMGGGDVSLDAPVRDDSEDSYIDFLASDEKSIEAKVARQEVSQNIKKHLEEFGKTLSDKEKKIFYERMIAEDPKTLQELGKEFGVSRERVRQIEARIKKKLKNYLKKRIPDVENYPLEMEEA